MHFSCIYISCSRLQVAIFSFCNTHFTFTFSFRLGKMYRYTIEKFDIKSLTNFATGFYKNVKAESIPMPKTPL
jgi:hypothetical protein